MSTTENQTQVINYINLTTEGIGYLSRVRYVTPKRSKESFLACSINAMHGNKDEKDGIQYVKFDVRVSGAKAIEVVEKLLMQAANNRGEAAKPGKDAIPGDKVLVSFKIGDYFIDTFTYEKGTNAGQTGTALKGRLLRINWAKVNGEKVYDGIEEAKAKAAADAAEAMAQADAEAQRTGTEG